MINIITRLRDGADAAKDILAAPEIKSCSLEVRKDLADYSMQARCALAALEGYLAGVLGAQAGRKAGETKFHRKQP